MDNKTLESRIKTAVDHVLPADDERLEKILSACGREDYSNMDNVISIENTAIKNASAESKNKKRGWIKWVSVAAAVAVVAASSLFGTAYYMSNIAVASGIVLDVNPSIEIKLNSKEIVLDVAANNADAEKILDGMDLKGTDLNVTVNALLGSMCKYGYIDSASNSILVTVEDDDAVHGAQMQQRIVDEINRILSSQSINGAVLSQSISSSDTDAAAAEIANKYGISLGKATLVHTLTTANPLLPENELAALSINELNLLLESQGSASQSGIASVGSASEQAYIGSDRAKEIAAADAGASADSIILKEVKIDYDDGAVEYDVEFCADGTEYEYSINATTGVIMSRESEPCDSAGHSHGSSQSGSGSQNGGNGQGAANQNGSGGQSNTSSGSQSVSGGQANNNQGTANNQGSVNSGTSQSNDIGLEAAKQAAFAHAGVTESNVTLIKSETDYDDGRKEYEIEFHSGGVEYDYVISAADGTILSYDLENKRPQNNTGTNNGSGNGQGSGNQSGDIGLDAAKQVAFAHAGVSESSAYEIKAEADYDDGRREYEIEFKYGGYEYEYVVSANGTIISHERDRDD